MNPSKIKEHKDANQSVEKVRPRKMQMKINKKKQHHAK